MAKRSLSRSKNDHIAVMQRCNAIKGETLPSDLTNQRDCGGLVFIDEVYVNRTVRRRIAAAERRENKKKGSQ
ncbi:hypothetical protein [Xenorhabdus bovienii]|uniref:Uncharacterized protein n=1 Tax=Xenorhabdus bovienii str. kraussei Quebec TaxID=1398203 RepID=A0A077P789_XENBV|nr:hypothetical protein [Xenorhabdus bovienii]MDE9455083.1 hypothetical protein [Xenorhabdus bovienii]CDH20330.1 conserved hypothetical protein [Xenorhabdus bovienii str. kraussei Quebec]